MKTYIIKYIWFKLIKSYELTAISFNDAIKEFNRTNPNIEKKYIRSVIIKH